MSSEKQVRNACRCTNGFYAEISQDPHVSSEKQVRKEVDLKYPVAQAIADAMTERCR